MKKQYAKKVYSFDYGRDIDRTKEPHEVGNFDVDFRKLDAGNPKGRAWTYGSSRKTLKGAEKDAEKIKDQTGAEVRIVNSLTGEILCMP